VFAPSSLDSQQVRDLGESPAIAVHEDDRDTLARCQFPEPPAKSGSPRLGPLRADVQHAKPPTPTAALAHAIEVRGGGRVTQTVAVLQALRALRRGSRQGGAVGRCQRLRRRVCFSKNRSKAESAS